MGGLLGKNHGRTDGLHAVGSPHADVEEEEYMYKIEKEVTYSFRPKVSTFSPTSTFGPDSCDTAKGRGRSV